MKTEIVNVTPQMASDWLQKNVSNRPLRRTVVNGIKAAIQRGEYVQTHQGIAFDSRGVLLDGQHRLTAISELRDGSFPMLVSHDVHPQAFMVMDTGIKRSASDSLQEDRRLVEVARLLAGMLDTRRMTITPPMLVGLIERIRQAHTSLVVFAPSTIKTWSSAPVRTAAVVSILRHVDADYVKAVYRALVLRDFAAMQPVAHALSRSVDIGAASASAGIDMFARCLVVFDPRAAQLSRVQIKDTTKALAIVRELFSLEAAAWEEEPPKKKAPAVTRGAKSVSRIDYRLEGL